MTITLLYVFLAPCLSAGRRDHLGTHRLPAGARAHARVLHRCQRQVLEARGANDAHNGEYRAGAYDRWAGRRRDEGYWRHSFIHSVYLCVSTCVCVCPHPSQPTSLVAKRAYPHLDMFTFQTKCYITNRQPRRLFGITTIFTVLIFLPLSRQRIKRTFPRRLWAISPAPAC